jgi:hypothetical protein
MAEKDEGFGKSVRLAKHQIAAAQATLKWLDQRLASLENRHDKVFQKLNRITKNPDRIKKH